LLRIGLGNCVAAGLYASLIAVAIKWRLHQRIPASVCCRSNSRRDCPVTEMIFLHQRIRNFSAIVISESLRTISNRTLS